MYSLAFLFFHWISQAFQRSVGKAGSEPVLLALLGLILFVIASKVRRPTSQLDIPQGMDTRTPIVGRMERTDRVPSVPLDVVGQLRS